MIDPKIRYNRTGALRLYRLRQGSTLADRVYTQITGRQPPWHAVPNDKRVPTSAEIQTDLLLRTANALGLKDGD